MLNSIFSFLDIIENPKVSWVGETRSFRIINLLIISIITALLYLYCICTYFLYIFCIFLTFIRKRSRSIILYFKDILYFSSPSPSPFLSYFKYHFLHFLQYLLFKSIFRSKQSTFASKRKCSHTSLIIFTAHRSNSLCKNREEKNIFVFSGRNSWKNFFLEEFLKNFEEFRRIL